MEARTKISELAQSVDNNYLMLSFATGTGKTKVALDIASKTKEKWYIVIYRLTHALAWKTDISKFNIDIDYEFITYKSFFKLKDQSGLNLIFDEAHHINENIVAYINKPTRMLCLSGSYSEERKLLLNSIGYFDEIVVTVNDAIKLGILNEPKVIFRTLELANMPGEYIYTFSRGSAVHRVDLGEVEFTRFFDIYSNNKPYAVDCFVKCNAEQYYTLINTEFINTVANSYRNPANKFLKLRIGIVGGMRKRAMAEIKHKYVKDYVLDKYNSGTRILYFANSIEQANELGVPVVHSQNGNTPKQIKENNEKVINKFNNGEYNIIANVSVLQESVNLFNVHEGVILQLDAAKRKINSTSSDTSAKFLQILGRSFRSENPLVTVFVLNNTKDMDYAKSVAKLINREYVEWK